MKFNLEAVFILVVAMHALSAQAQRGSAGLEAFAVRLGQCASQNAGYDEGTCSLAVREITECAGTGIGWCSGSAVNYNSCPYTCDKVNAKDCNDQYFSNWTRVSRKSPACQQQGTIRIYKGHCDEFKYYASSTSARDIRSKRSQCLQKLKALRFIAKNGGDSELMPGDFHGHIEVVGYHAQVFHHYKDSQFPIDSPQELGNRRVLIQCLTPNL